ncbi:hypothetical protein HanOQP8_Chr06g0230371 [Helianthus annuus]|nr:hypothetical protein HanLR1_Chr06g0222001 [Helianthus annuus]KAJ0741642.1 hypothetical protein HanOQP8_Chr06g0230371 [Helianthus annuus]
MGARKDQSTSYSRLTQEEVEAFCAQWGINLKFNPVAPGLDKSIDQCLAGSIALYCRHFEFSNLRHPFSIFVLNVLEYYRISFGQIHPRGLARILHFESICRAAGYDSSLLSFRRFFRLAKNGDWFTFEKSQVDTCLISSMVTTLGSWKDRFFWVSESIIPFKMIWRHPDAVLNELEPSDSELDSCCGINRMLCSLMLHLLKVRMLVRGSEHRFEGSGYISVANVKGFAKVAASKASTRRPTRRKGAGRPSSSETIDLGDDLEIYEDLEVPTDGKKGELPLVVAKDNKALGKKVGGGGLKPSGKAIECVLQMLTRGKYMCLIGRMQEYEAFSKKKREAMKVSMAALKKESEGFAEKEKAWQMKVHELTQRHEVEVGELKKQVEASSSSLSIRVYNTSRRFILYIFQSLV